MRPYTPHLQVNEQQLKSNSQGERRKEIMPFVWGISANVGILSWFFHCFRSNINFFEAHSRFVSLKQGNNSLMYSLYLATVCILLWVFWQVQSVIQASDAPHPLSTRAAVSWSTFLLYLLYHPLGGTSRPGSGQSDPGLSCTFAASISRRWNLENQLNPQLRQMNTRGDQAPAADAN